MHIGEASNKVADLPKEGQILSSNLYGYNMQPEKTLPVAEIFHTFQGEGPSLGTPATFVRLMGCNLTCTFCDTPYTWKKDVLAIPELLTADQLLKRIQTKTPRLLVVTGGEPLLHHASSVFWDLISSFNHCGLEIETNGTIGPSSWAFTMTPVLRAVVHSVTFNVSPKLVNSIKDPSSRKRLPAVPYDEWNSLPSLIGKVRFKFVVGNETDFHEVCLVVSANRIKPQHVVIMPKGNTVEELLLSHSEMTKYSKEASDLGYTLTTRLHTLLFNGERGL